VGRPAEVFVGEVSMAEGQKLARIGRTAKDPVKLRRAIVVLMSAQGQSVPDIAELMQVGADYVRDVIHAFNERGLAALDPKWSGGRPRAIDAESAGGICAIAKADPRLFGLPFSCWSLVKLRDHLVAAGEITRVSAETLRRVLKRGGVSWQATKTWKASNDPEFVPKMRRVLDLDDHPPVGGRVISVDEFGPLNLQPRAGKAWRRESHPVRLRATYHRTQGVRHMIAGLDLATGKLFYRIRDRKRWREFLSFLKSLRARWTGQRLSLIVDNFSPHKHPEVRSWAAASDVELVFLPTYASWLNWIEAHLAALRYFALNGTDHRSH